VSLLFIKDTPLPREAASFIFQSSTKYFISTFKRTTWSLETAITRLSNASNHRMIYTKGNTAARRKASLLFLFFIPKVSATELRAEHGNRPRGPRLYLVMGVSILHGRPVNRHRYEELRRESREITSGLCRYVGRRVAISKPSYRR